MVFSNNYTEQRTFIHIYTSLAEQLNDLPFSPMWIWLPPTHIPWYLHIIINLALWPLLHGSDSSTLSANLKSEFFLTLSILCLVVILTYSTFCPAIGWLVFLPSQRINDKNCLHKLEREILGNKHDSKHWDNLWGQKSKHLNNWG